MWALLLALAQESDPFVERAEAAGAALLATVDPVEQARAVGLLDSYSGDPNPKVAAPALKSLALYARLCLDREGASAAGSALDVLFRRGHDDYPELILGVLTSRLDGSSRRAALGLLHRASGGKAVPWLGPALADPELAETAARLIGLSAGGSRNPELIRRLIAEGEASRTPHELASFAWALRAVGGDAVRPALAPWIDRLRGWSRTDVAWFVHGTDPRHVLDRLVELGVLPRAPGQDVLNAYRVFEPRGPSPTSQDFVLSALEGKVCLPVCRQGLPPDYPLFLRYFSQVSRGRLKLQDIREKDGVFHFTQSGRGYEIVPAKLGDAMDIPSLLKAVNQALEDEGAAERFVGLEHGGPFAIFVMTNPESLQRAARELHLALEPDPDAARKRWLNGR